MTAPDDIRKALKALNSLVDIVSEDTGALKMSDADEDSVGWTEEGPLPMTFGHVRRAHAALAALEAALSAAEPAGEVAGQQGRYWLSNEGRWSNWFDITFNTWVPETGIREVRNIYAAPPAPSVAVKDLEWHGHGDYHRADSILGTYHVRFGYDEGRRPEFLTPYSINWKWRDEDKTITDAKSAAQADYEARIRSALA